MNKIVEEIAEILKQTQGGLRETIKTQATMKILGKGYMIYSKTDKPKPMLCVHLDTINTHRPKCKIKPQRDFEFDEVQGILGLQKNSPLACLGGDDRAGVWIALAMIEYMEASGDYKYDVGFFEDEEIGCHGSTYYSQDRDSFDINTTCYIGLDRKSTKGVQEVALYGDDNKELVKIFNDLGYVTDVGSITDAAVLATNNIACVNLSVGYDNEHTKSEVLYLYCMIDTLEKLKALELKSEPYIADYDHFFDVNPWGDKYSAYYSPDWYLEELEEENEILRAYLESLNVDVDALLKKAKTYDF